MPLGAELIQIIVPNLKIEFDQGLQIAGDKEVCNALRAHTKDGNINPYLEAAWLISSGAPLDYSIDSFIDKHKDNECIQLCGKLAITNAIMSAERGSLLYSEPHNRNSKPLQFDHLANTWFVKFFKILSYNVDRTNIDCLFDNVSIINFNYDRCVEHFLFEAILALYGVEEGKAQEVAHKLKILRPYGKIGHLPWEVTTGSIPFGGFKGDPAALLKLSQGIRTYTQQIEEADTLAAIRQEVNRAEAIVFLGFAYHEQNMQLIAPPHPTAVKRIYATAYGVSGTDRAIVHDYLFKLFAPQRSDLRLGIALKCAALFDEYQRTLAVPI